MADDVNNEDKKDKKDKEKQGDEDFGALTDGGGVSGDSSLGNLPPLSDFDSVSGTSESDLPSMDDLTSSPGPESPAAGLPPISDMQLETPSDAASPPTPDVGIGDTPSFESPATPSSDLDTPDPTDGMGFQDLAADSDFSPETPEIGPGPDSDIETPMFDSAFGGDSGEFASPASTPPGPTKTMETPMFDSAADTPSDGLGFDKDAFGGPSGVGVAQETGTPIPDFSPDTGVPQQAPTGPPPEPPRQKKGSRAVTMVLMVLVFILGGGAMFAVEYFTPFQNPATVEELAAEHKIEIDGKDSIIARLKNVRDTGEEEISQDTLDDLLSDIELRGDELNKLEEDVAVAESRMAESEAALAMILNDVEEANERFVEAQEFLDNLKNETAITQARHEGLLAENERLTEMVGSLEVANARRQATKDTLLHNLDLMVIQIESGIPLTPERFSHAGRLAKAKALRNRATEVRWVDPALLDEYTAMYLAEMDISSSHEYFFAKIPVHDGLGSTYMKWAECLMNGNWSVYYRTIDGKHVGSYESIPGVTPPRYEFREDLPDGVRGHINSLIVAERIDDYEDKITVLREKQAVFETKSKTQRNFDSL